MSTVSLYCDKKALLQRLKMMNAHCATTAENDVHSKFEALFEVNDATGNIVLTTNNLSKPARICLSVEAKISAIPTHLPPLVFDVSELISILKALGGKWCDIELQVDFESQSVRIFKVRKISADLLNADDQFHRVEQQFTSSLYIEQLDSVHNFTAPEETTDFAAWLVSENDLKVLNNAVVFADECHPQNLFISLTCGEDGCSLSIQSELGHNCSVQVFKHDTASRRHFTNVAVTKDQLKALSSLCQTIFKLGDNVKIEISDTVILTAGDSFTAQIYLEHSFDLIQKTANEDDYASFTINKKLTDILSAHSQSAQIRPKDSVTISSDEQSNALQLRFEIGKSQSIGGVNVSDFARHTRKVLDVRLNRAILAAALKLVQTKNQKAQVSVSESAMQLSSSDNCLYASVYLLG
ncbi:MAG: hypothetical protein ACQEQ2_05600 [Pseudomonadota bacterium]